MRYLGVFLSFFGALYILYNSNEKSVFDLHGTKWVSVISEGYVDTLTFADTTYISYSSETDSRFYGTYKMHNDTLQLVEIGEYAIYDTSYHPSSEQIKLYLKREEGKLFYYKRYTMEDGVWRDSEFEFDNRYYFKKIK